MRKLFSICSILTFVLLAIVAVRNMNPEWKGYQREFRKVAAGHLSGDMLKIATADGVSMKQVYLQELSRIDRCVTCHLSIDIPGMESAAQPFTTHPGNYLATHPKEKYGCTVCHEGQGLATNAADAHAMDIKFWERPMLVGNLLYSTCMKCHKEDSAINTAMYRKGKSLFEDSGCLGCHKLNGKGGHLGPDLSDISRASIYTKHPLMHNAAQEAPAEENAHGEKPELYGNLNVEYIYEAVKTPKAQPAQSSMVDYGFSTDEAMAITVFLKGQSLEKMPSDFVVSKVETDDVNVVKGHGIYRKYCVACHGGRGEGTDLPELGGTVGPAVGNQQFLSVADMPMLERVISDSRGGVMPAWGKSGGLTAGEIASVAQYLHTMRQDPPSYEEVISFDGNAKYGASFFQGNCAACHGRGGFYETGLIGPSLRSRELHSLGGDRFWYDTLVNGREGTAMPSWSYLTREQFSDLIKYLRSFREANSSFASVKKYLAGSPSVKDGKSTYRGYCSGCHGLTGGGGIGPSLNSPEFQAVADVDFMVRVVTSGRTGTAMPRFTYLSAERLGDAIAYIKTWQSTPSKKLSGNPVHGSEYRGSIMFDKMCAQCHGDHGQGKIGPAILGQGFLDTVSDEFIMEMISYGRSGTAMRPNLVGKQGLVNLSREQVSDIVAFIRSFKDRPANLSGIPSVDGTTENGRTKFGMYCEQCHGQAGIGGTGPAIGKKGFLDTVSDGFIQAIAMNGRTGTEMKPFSGDEAGGGLAALSEADIDDIIYYLRVMSKDNTGSSKHVIGDPGAGEILFKHECSQCHGDMGRKGFAPALANKSFMNAASDSYLQATMVIGRHDTQMRSMVRGGGGVVEMDSTDINNIIVYLKSLEKTFQ